MKTIKIVIGAMAAAMLSLSVCSFIPAVAADDTVQITVSNETAKAGGDFEVKVSVADIPAAGIQCLNFGLEFDSSLISIDSIAYMLPMFNYFSEGEGVVSVMWSTAASDASWMKTDGEFVTVSGKVSSSAKDGDVAEIKVIPTKRDTFTGSGVANDEIDCGYTKGEESIRYSVKTTDGSVTIGTSAAGLKGDANVDGKVNVSDAVAVLQFVANKSKYPLEAQGQKNADCDGESGITGGDALYIQKIDAGLIK